MNSEVDFVAKIYQFSDNFTKQNRGKKQLFNGTITSNMNLLYLIYSLSTTKHIHQVQARSMHEYTPSRRMQAERNLLKCDQSEYYNINAFGWYEKIDCGIYAMFQPI